MDQKELMIRYAASEEMLKAAKAIRTGIREYHQGLYDGLDQLNAESSPDEIREVLAEVKHQIRCFLERTPKSEPAEKVHPQIITPDRL